MPQGQGYGSVQAQPGGLQPSPGQKAALDSFSNQQRPFGWLMDMIQHITGQVQQPAGQPQSGQQQPQGQQPQQQGQPPQGKQSDASGGQQPGQQGQVPGGMVDPASVQMLTSLFQPNALSNLGLLPQQQGNWNWVLSMMQQQQAGQAKEKGMGGNDLLSIIRQMGQGGGSMAPKAGGASKPTSSGAGKG